MATERPPGVASSASAKTLTRPGLTGRAVIRKAGPRPCNLPSMKRSNINDSSHVEIVPPGSTGWAKTSKPASIVPPTSTSTSTAGVVVGGDDANSNTTWTVPARHTDKPAKSVAAETRSVAVVKKPNPKPSEPTKVDDDVTAPSSIIDNPFGIDISVTSWAREVSPPPPSKRAWSDASPMDFTKPVVFEQPPSTAPSTTGSSGARHTGPPPDNAWRRAVVRKPTVSSILKKPDPVSISEPEALPSPAPTDPTPAVSQRPAVVAAPVIDETVQAMTMKQKAEMAMRRREEEERLRREEVHARLAEKLAALEKKEKLAALEKKTTKQQQIHSPISVMQRPKEMESITTSSSTATTPTTNTAQPPPHTSSESTPTTAPSPPSLTSDIKPKGRSGPPSSHTLELSKAQAAGSHPASNTERSGRQPFNGRSSDRPRDLQDDPKASQSSRRDRRHTHRRHFEPPGSTSVEAQAWTRPGHNLERDDGKRASDKAGPNDGERPESVSGREPAASVPSKDSARREDNKSRRSAKTFAKSHPRQSGQESRPSDPSEPIPELDPRAGPFTSKSKPSHGHRKWRAKESNSPISSPDDTPVSVPAEPALLDSGTAAAVIQEKSLSDLSAASAPPTRHAPRQWKSALPDAQQPEADKKRHRPKRSGGRRPDPFRSVFENVPVVSSEAGTTMWSAAAPVIGSSGAISSSGSLAAAPRSWATPKSSKSHNALLLTRQQSRMKGSPGAGLAARALADTLAASRSN